MSFRDAVIASETRVVSNITQTENGMRAFKSTLDANVDLFFKIGASRGKDITASFEAALRENPEAALRILQWTRDIRGGSGERELFRQGLRYLEKNYKDYLTDTLILPKVPELGRWDDLLIFTDEDLKERAFTLIAEALEADNGLCAKWMPRKGQTAVELRNFLGLTPKKYRKLLVNLTKVVETQMCAQDWDEINFSHVPSLAMSRYTKAFAKNAPEQFAAFKEALVKGTDPKVKVNSGAVYPYDLVKTTMWGDSTIADEQWKALPNFMGDSKVLPMVDVSGSMCSPAAGSKVSCLDVAVSLGLYCSDKNTGPFKDTFLTFSTTPEFVTLRGSLSEKLKTMVRSNWAMSTDLHRALDKVLRTAIRGNVAEEDMPDALLILSDMQFNRCARFDNSAFGMIKRKYEDAGYKMPAIVFWNLRATDNVPVRYDERGTALVSGFSPSIMKSVLAADFDNMTPEGVMKKTIMSDRYAVYAA